MTTSLRSSDGTTVATVISDRDGVARYDISEIGRERRTGYSWYNSDALEVYERFGEWEKKYGSAKGKQ